MLPRPGGVAGGLIVGVVDPCPGGIVLAPDGPPPPADVDGVLPPGMVGGDVARGVEPGSTTDGDPYRSNVMLARH